MLLAEDNAVNQRLVVRLLEKQGHEVVVVGNGKEALAALGADRGAPSGFDLVLMDVQMPEMGGFEATTAIRAQERGTGRRLPIVALTAHAMKGDRERCLEAGMDDYICKPIQREELIQMIDNLTRRPEPAAASQAQSPEPASAFDRTAALQRMEGDEALLLELVEIFRTDCPRLLDAIRTAVAARNSPALRRSAHTLKGSLLYLGAAPACEAARQLEALGSAGDLDAAPQALAILEVEMERLVLALADAFASTETTVAPCLAVTR